MSYILDGSTLKSPNSIRESNSTQYAENRTLDGSVRRDFFGSNKRIWVLEYDNTKKGDYDTIKTIYDSYLSTNTAKSWQSTETNYTISSTNVHVDLFIREFQVKGTSYISSFVLTLKEA